MRPAVAWNALAPEILRGEGSLHQEEPDELVLRQAGQQALRPYQRPNATGL